MAETTASSAQSSDGEVYRAHWSRVYAEDATQLEREWHCSTEDALPFIGPYVAHAASRAGGCDGSDPGSSGLVVDVGCGSSSMGHDLWRRFGFAHLLMTDIDDGIVGIMRERYGTSPCTGRNGHEVSGSNLGGGGGGGGGDVGEGNARARRRTVRCEVADCRSMPTVPDGCAAVVVDKGTIDALSGDIDKMAMIRECLRMLSPDGGVVVSVSFPSAARVALLDRAAEELGVECRIRVLTEGDPKYGHQAVFVAVLGRHLADVAPEDRDKMSENLLARARRSGSMIEDEAPGEQDRLTIFDHSDED